MINLSEVQNVLNQTFAPALADQLNNRVDVVRLVPKTIGGGKNIAFDVKVASDHVAGSYADGATMTGGGGNAKSTRVPAILQWKLVKAEFSLSGLALATASSSGPAALANLFKTEIQDAARDLAVSLATQFYGDGTGNTNLDLDGLGAIIATSGTYAGINRATYSTWRATRLANGAVARALTKNLMDQAERAVFRASGFRPSVIVTTPEVYTKYEALFDSVVRTDSANRVYSLGAEALAYKGIPVIRDARCPAGTMYFLSVDCCRFEQLPPLGMAEGNQLVQGYQPIVDPEGNVGLQVGIELLGKTGDKIDGFLKVYGNMACTNPNQQAVIVDIEE